MDTKIHNSKFALRSLGEGGYATLLVSLFITVGVLVVALVVSNIVFLGRFDTLGSELSDVSREVGKGCLEYARLELSVNLNYAGNETKNIGTYSCQILPIENGAGNQKIIKSRAVVGQRVANLKLTVSIPSLQIVYFEEESSF